MNNDVFIDNRSFERVNKKIIDIQIIRSEILKFIVEYFSKRDYLLIDPPIIHEYIPDKKSEVYFAIDDYMFALNSSNALYLSAYAVMLGQVFAISPTFRKEGSNSHLTEFKMLEVELLNCSFDDCLGLITDFIKSLLFHLSEIGKKTFFAERIEMLHQNFQVEFMSYSDIVGNLKSSGCAIEYGDDLSDYDDKVSNIVTSPTFVIDYPVPVASWTALPKESKIAYAFNLILPNQYGELAEGCQRNNNHRIFEYKFEKADIHSLDWYVSAIKKCNCNRSGFGLGIERLIRWLVGTKNIADTVLFPRFEEKGVDCVKIY